MRASTESADAGSGEWRFEYCAQALEPIGQIVSQQHQVEVGFVGQEVMAGDTAECVISLELGNDQFDASTVVVEAPEVERLQRQIGDQDLVMEAA